MTVDRFRVRSSSYVFLDERYQGIKEGSLQILFFPRRPDTDRDTDGIGTTQIPELAGSFLSRIISSTEAAILEDHMFFSPGSLDLKRFEKPLGGSGSSCHFPDLEILCLTIIYSILSVLIAVLSVLRPG